MTKSKTKLTPVQHMPAETTMRDLMNDAAIAVKDNFSADEARTVLQNHGFNKLRDVPADREEEMRDAFIAAMSKPSRRKTSIPSALAAPYGKSAPHAQLDKIQTGGKNVADYGISLPGDLHHTTTTLVLDTANLMGQKLFNAQQKYGFVNGWQDSKWANPKEGATFEANDDAACRAHAFSHVLKGDPVDVANYSAFQMFHGWSSAPQSREEAKSWVAMLQEKFDLIDENAQLRELIEQMEERHGDTFNAFFETILKRVMLSSGATELTLDTNNLLPELLDGAGALQVSEAPGKLIYRLVQGGGH